MTEPTQGISADKTFYDEVPIQGDLTAHFVELGAYTDQWTRELNLLFPQRSGLEMLELGAGTCGTSLLASKSDKVQGICASDISSKKMKDHVDRTAAHVGGNKEKIRFQEIDFNTGLPFAEKSFDLVVFDAALHHSRNIWATLEECFRITRDDGYVIAQREAFLSPLSFKIATRRMIESKEVAYGVSENAYLLAQYDYYFAANGFSMKAYPVYPNWKFSLLRPLNGLLFSKYNMIAKKEPDFRAALMSRFR